MGLFSKIKSMFKGESKPQEKEIEKVEKVIEEEEVEEQRVETKEQPSVKEVEHKEEIFSEKETKKEISSEKEIKKEPEIKEDTTTSEVPTKKANKVYEKGLTKSRKGFVSNLINLTSKYHRINEEYFEELEEILIMADIGVNTVMEFMDRLRSRVQKEKIEDPEALKEIIVD